MAVAGTARRQRCGAGAANGDQAHRSPAPRPQRPRTRGRPGTRRLRSRDRVRQAPPPGRRDRLCHRRLAGVRGRGQPAGDPRGRRGPVHPRRSHPRGEERRPRQRGGARHLFRRKRESRSSSAGQKATQKERVLHQHPLRRIRSIPGRAPRALLKGGHRGPDHCQTRQRTGCRHDRHSSVQAGDSAGIGARRPAPAHRRDAVPRSGDRHRRLPGRAARDDPEARALLGDASTTGASARRSSRRCRTSSPRSTGWTSTSSTSARSTRTRCRSSSRTDGRARSSSS